MKLFSFLVFFFESVAHVAPAYLGFLILPFPECWDLYARATMHDFMHGWGLNPGLCILDKYSASSSPRSSVAFLIGSSVCSGWP